MLCPVLMPKDTGKKVVKVNDFKVPEDWYEGVKRLAARRGTSIPVTIQWLVDIAMPIAEEVQESERKTLEGMYAKVRGHPTRKSG